MVQRVSTVAFEGIEARAVDVQVQVAPGLPAFAKVWNINSLIAPPLTACSLIAMPRGVGRASNGAMCRR
jgi:hypothetical protein